MATKKDNTSADMSVEQKLKNLYSLQTKLSEIDEIKTLRGELPLEVQDLEDEIAGLLLRLQKYEDEIEHIKEDVTRKQESIKEAQAMMARYQSQLDNVSNNREYDNLSKEIEFQSLEIELLRKKINDAERLINLKTGDLEKGRTALAARQQDLEQKKAELDEIVASTKADEKKSSAKRLSLSKLPLNHAFSLHSNAFVKALVMVLALSMCNAMLVVVASIRFPLSANLTFVCAKRLSYANTVVAL